MKTESHDCRRSGGGAPAAARVRADWPSDETCSALESPRRPFLSWNLGFSISIKHYSYRFRSSASSLQLPFIQRPGLRSSVLLIRTMFGDIHARVRKIKELQHHQAAFNCEGHACMHGRSLAVPRELKILLNGSTLSKCTSPAN